MRKNSVWYFATNAALRSSAEASCARPLNRVISPAALSASAGMNPCRARSRICGGPGGHGVAHPSCRACARRAIGNDPYSDTNAARTRPTSYTSPPPIVPA